MNNLKDVLTCNTSGNFQFIPQESIDLRRIELVIFKKRKIWIFDIVFIYKITNKTALDREDTLGGLFV